MMDPKHSLYYTFRSPPNLVHDRGCSNGAPIFMVQSYYFYGASLSFCPISHHPPHPYLKKCVHWQLGRKTTIASVLARVCFLSL